MKHNKIDRCIFLDIELKFAEIKTINRIAKHYNVDNATIKNVLIEAGLDPYFYKKQENEIRNQAAEYYCQGNSLSQCCKKFKLSWSKLTKTLTDQQLLRVDTNTNLLCKICNQEFNNKDVFSKHIFCVHKMKSKHYYDCFCKKSTEGFCVICNGETQYTGFVRGYRNTCSHICGGILQRQDLKKDVNKHKKFVETVSSNAKQRHANMSAEKKSLIGQKISTSLKAFNLLLTDEQRVQRYGWLNKLSECEKNNFIQSVMTQTGFHQWWKMSSQEEKELVYQKRSSTKSQKNKIFAKNAYNAFLTYQQKVHNLTSKTYKKFKTIINPTNLPRKQGTKGYHLDHKYSIFQGFVEGLSAEIISSKGNLQMLSGFENISKGTKCSITKEFLLALYEKELQI